jgi:hypothetical protein
MRIEGISPDTSRAAVAAARASTVQAQQPTPAAPKATSPVTDADGDHDGDTGTKGSLIDVGA